jgi:hypothetical protein
MAASQYNPVMATIHISQSEAERDLNSLLARLNGETSFVIEHDSQPIALLQSTTGNLPLRERLAKLSDDTEATMDDAFAQDVEAGIAAHREALDARIYEA